MQVEQCDNAIASRIKTALEQGEGASNAIHLAAQIAATHRIAERERCARIVEDYPSPMDDLPMVMALRGIAGTIRNEIERTDNAS
jgi:hypothetical protein